MDDFMTALETGTADTVSGDMRETFSSCRRIQAVLFALIQPFHNLLFLKAQLGSLVRLLHS